FGHRKPVPNGLISILDKESADFLAKPSANFGGNENEDPLANRITINLFLGSYEALTAYRLVARSSFPLFSALLTFVRA
ncbi:MAG: hypothetical protein EBS61_13950, partial [Betaproteobacteria bacterium]|nr:hypothetical protein [Betaproteobacteria bacterium]